MGACDPPRVDHCQAGLGSIPGAGGPSQSAMFLNSTMASVVLKVLVGLFWTAATA